MYSPIRSIDVLARIVLGVAIGGKRPQPSVARGDARFSSDG
jgi:hypothetical protein